MASKNDWTQKVSIGNVTFTPVNDGAECSKKVSYGFSSVRACGRPAVTLVGGSRSYENGLRCAQHAAPTKRSAQNDVDRQAASAERRRIASERTARDDAAKARIEAHGIDLSTYKYATPGWTAIAGWLDQIEEGDR